jgi:gamma-glutamyl-gamma-aminobutyrate hydrolase PuuD
MRNWLSAIIVSVLLFASSLTAVAGDRPEQRADVLVITDRAATRMQPEIHHAFRDAAKRGETSSAVKFKFTVFNPYLPASASSSPIGVATAEIRGQLPLVVGVVSDLKRRLAPGQSMVNAVQDYARRYPGSAIAELQRLVGGLMEHYDLLIIESTGATVIHPIFYNPDVGEVEVGYATADDIKDTLYGLFFLESALEQGKPIFGTCHGAQLGWMLLGGGLTRLFDYTEEVPSGAYIARRNPNTGLTEFWWMDRMLNSRNPKDKTEYGDIAYPLTEPFAQGREGKLVNKDFNHTLAMTAPIPAGVEVLSHHPLSIGECAEASVEIDGPIDGYPMVTKASRERFWSLLKEIEIIDAFAYKTLYGFQFHPQYTVDDQETAAIFEYLVKMTELR